MVNASRYLKRRRGKGPSGERLYLQVPVPKDLRPRFGATIERCLRTDSAKVARIRQDEALPDIRAMCEAARAEPTLERALGPIRRAEPSRADAQWCETIAERGLAGAP